MENTKNEKTLTCKVDEETHRAIRVMAAQNGVTTQQVLLTLIHSITKKVTTPTTT